mmetsp:Transcript_1070/g.3220  ORF Transcript_1070/g.3220 Transcript_1070/m.3220 type:complete len:237 (+) Transcript_1070:616-1326(+)
MRHDSLPPCIRRDLAEATGEPLLRPCLVRLRRANSQGWHKVKSFIRVHIEDDKHLPGAGLLKAAHDPSQRNGLLPVPAARALAVQAHPLGKAKELRVHVLVPEATDVQASQMHRPIIHCHPSAPSAAIWDRLDAEDRQTPGSRQPGGPGRDLAAGRCRATRGGRRLMQNHAHEIWLLIQIFPLPSIQPGQAVELAVGGVYAAHDGCLWKRQVEMLEHGIVRVRPRAQQVSHRPLQK